MEALPIELEGLYLLLFELNIEVIASRFSGCGGSSCIVVEVASCIFFFFCLIPNCCLRATTQFEIEAIKIALKKGEPSEYGSSRAKLLRNHLIWVWLYPRPSLLPPYQHA